ncbi:MAG: hypothetical protein Q8L64_04445 [bacterium]|nr:hypothetical protein [bacterium]
MGVEFNEENIGRRDFGGTKVPKLAGWLISRGLAKDEAGANKIQLIVALVFFALAILLFIK